MRVKQLQGFMRVPAENKKVANIDFKGVGLYMRIVNDLPDDPGDQEYKINIQALAGNMLAKKHVINHLQSFEKIGAIKIVSMSDDEAVIKVTRYE